MSSNSNTPSTVPSSLSSIFEEVDRFVDERFETWRSWRRHLHMHPERAWTEQCTTTFIREKLADMGLHLQPGPRDMGGFVDLQHGDLSRQGGKQRFAVRGDIDAIPVLEANDIDYRSQVEGLMHACGHDAHATTVLAVCDTLQHLSKSLQIELPFNFRAIFQPAEEVAEGAAEAIAVGALTDVDAILAMHVDPSLEFGTVGLRDAVQTAQCDEIKVMVTGVGGHGARPHETCDPILAATQFISTAYAMVPRVYDARKQLVLSFCEIKGGNSANVIPVDVSIRGTMRSFDHATCEQTFTRLGELAEHLGKALRVSIDIQRGVSVPSVNNAMRTNELVRSVIAGGSDDLAKVVEVDRSLGGEDFAFYQQEIAGSLIRLGTAGSAKSGENSAHLHSPNFNIDERVIGLGCKVFVRSVLKWFADQTGEQI